MQGRGRTDVVGDDLTEAAQGVGLGRLGRGEVETARRLGEGVQQHRLALPTPPGHHTECRARSVVEREAGDVVPLVVPVEYLGWLARQLHSKKCTS